MKRFYQILRLCVNRKQKKISQGCEKKAKRENSNGKVNDICRVCRKVNRIFSYESEIHGGISDSLFTFEVLNAIKCDSCDDNQALENELQVSVDSQESKTVGEAGEDDYTDYRATNFTDTTVE